jgi:hypothetical protein
MEPCNILTAGTDVVRIWEVCFSFILSMGRAPYNFARHPARAQADPRLPHSLFCELSPPPQKNSFTSHTRVTQTPHLLHTSFPPLPSKLHPDTAALHPRFHTPPLALPPSVGDHA